MEAGEGTRVPQSRLFGALIRGRGVAPHGFISEAASLVSIVAARFPSLFPVAFLLFTLRSFPSCLLFLLLQSPGIFGI